LPGFTAAFEEAFARLAGEVVVVRAGAGELDGAGEVAASLSMY
jgi:hypothetical protein